MFSVLLLTWGFVAIRRRSLPESLRSPLTLAIGAHAFWIFLSALASQNRALSLPRLPGLSLFLVVPIAIDLLDREERVERLVLALGLGGALLSLPGLWQFAHGGDDVNNRIRGTLSHYMTFSGLTMISGCLLLGFLLEGRGRRRLVGILAAVPLVAMLLTFTRNAYVGLLVALVLFFVFRSPRKLLFLLPAVGLVFLLLPAAVRSRVLSIGDLNDPTSRDRIAMARAGWKMVEEHPVFGVGEGLVKALYPIYRSADAGRRRVGHLHDNAVQIAASSGLPAAAAYAVTVGLFFARTLRLLRRERRARRAALFAGTFLAGAAITVAGLFEYNFGDTEVLMATLLVLAIPFSRAFERGGSEGVPLRWRSPQRVAAFSAAAGEGLPP